MQALPYCDHNFILLFSVQEFCIIDELLLYLVMFPFVTLFRVEYFLFSVHTFLMEQTKGLLSFKAVVQTQRFRSK